MGHAQFPRSLTDLSGLRGRAPTTFPRMRMFSTKPIALGRVVLLAPVVAFLVRRGAPVERLLAKAHLPMCVLDRPEVFDSPPARLPVHGGGCLGARRQEPGAAGRRAGTGRLARCLRSSDRTRALLRGGDRNGDVRHAGPSPRTVTTRCPATATAFAGASATWVTRVDGCRQADQYAAMLAMNVLRLADPTLANTKVVFESGETVVTFPSSLLNRPLVRSQVVARIRDDDVEAWKASGPAEDFPGSVLQVMTTLSSPEYPRIGLTAQAIGVSVRGLQRRLAQTGVGYEGLVARSRLDTALHLLEATDATVLDIALDLGYSDHAHFTRAFRRWTGMPPREFRRTRNGASATWLAPLALGSGPTRAARS